VTEGPDLSQCAGCDVPSSALWCRRCTRLVWNATVDVDRLSVWLEQQADGFSSRSPGTYMTSRGSAVEAPSPAPLIDLVDKVYADLVEFEGAWRRHQGYPPSRRISLGRTTHDRSVTLAFLARHLTSILREPEMCERIRVLLRWRIVLRRYAHAESEQRDRPGRCPQCHMVNVLVGDSESETVRCRNCAVVLTEDGYQDEVVADPDPDVVAESRAALEL
jgi:hypothetical protein